MSRSVNQVILIGNVGRDAEIRQAGNSSVTQFSLATSYRWKDKQSGELKEETNWTNIVAWNSDKVAEFIKKGKQIFVRGRLHTRSYEKDGQKVWATEVVADEIILLGSGGDRATPTQSSDEDVPF